MRLAIVVSRFNGELTGRMRDLAVKRAEAKGAEVVALLEVPGTMEVPLALSRLLQRSDVDAAVVLGAVVQGETRHDEVIVQAVASEVARLSVVHDKPVGFGITGPGMTWKQAEARVGYAERAVDAALDLHAALND